MGSRTHRRGLGSRLGGGHGRGEAGMTLVEALIAMALLLLVSIGILPLFTRSMINNASGNEATQTANNARGQLENLAQLAFDNEALRIVAGNQLLTRDVYFSGAQNVQGDEAWAAPDAGTGFVIFERATRVRQFGLNAVLDDNADNIVDGFAGLVDDDHDGEYDNPLPAGMDPQFVHFKEVAVEVVTPRNRAEGGPSGPLGASPTYRVRTIKSF